jgi:hypothetical protein
LRQLERLAELTTQEQFLLFRALCVVTFARLALWTVPVADARSATAKIAGVGRRASLQQVVWAVRSVSRCVPGATCLTQAVAVQALLINAGYECRIGLGVAKDSGCLKAHAWVVYENEIIIGGPDIATYVQLADLALPSRQSLVTYDAVI